MVELIVAAISLYTTESITVLAALLFAYKAISLYRGKATGGGGKSA